MGRAACAPDVVQRLPVVLPATHCTAQRAQDPQDGTDDDQNDADRPEDGDVDDGSYDQEDESENDHEVFPFYTARESRIMR